MRKTCYAAAFAAAMAISAPAMADDGGLWQALMAMMFGSGDPSSPDCVCDGDGL